MTIRPKLILELFAVFVSVASCPSFAQNQAAVTPDAATTVTTAGGTSGTLPLFTGASTIANSIVFQNSTTGIGIGAHPSSTAMLDVNGKAIVRGIFNLSRTGNATTSARLRLLPVHLQHQRLEHCGRRGFLPDLRVASRSGRQRYREPLCHV